MTTEGLNLGGVRSFADLQLRCVVEELTGCWLWHGAFSKSGTPVTYIPGLRETGSIGVAVCFLKTGARPLPGAVWHSTCRKVACANPMHRGPGNHSTKTIGTRQPAHTAKLTVARRARAKVTAEEAALIAGSEEAASVLMARYRLSRSQVARIKKGHLWKPLGAPNSSVFNWRP